MYRTKIILQHNLPIILFFLLWEVVANSSLVNPMLLPAFSKVIMTLGGLFYSGELLTHTLISLERALGGFVAALVIGIPLGFLMGGWFRTTQTVLAPLFDISSQVNPFILFHIIILFLGIGETAKITIIAWVCIWPILFNTAAGVRNVDEILLKEARSFDLKRWSIFYKIILPSAARSIFTGIRISAGYSFFLLIAVEVMGADSGLGWFILYSQENYNVEAIFAGAVVIALLGVTMDAGIKYIEKKIIIWQ